MYMYRWKIGLLAIFLVAILLLGIFYFAFAHFVAMPTGIWLYPQITVYFDDGSKITVSSEAKNILTDALLKLSVLTNQGKKIQHISVDLIAKYFIHPRDATVNVQNWFQYYIEISGVYAYGLREYDVLTGFTDLFYSSEYDTERTSRWILLYNNPYSSWTGITDFVKYFYREAGTGLQLGLLNLGPEFAYEVVTSLEGNPVPKKLAEKLTAILGVKNYRHRDVDEIISWEMDGWDFYSYLKRMDWQGLAIHLGDYFSIGAGKWLRMHDGDKYKIVFYVAYFFRYQDITGEWTPWKADIYKLGELELKVEEGTWILLDIVIEGGINVQT